MLDTDQNRAIGLNAWTWIWVALVSLSITVVAHQIHLREVHLGVVSLPLQVELMFYAKLLLVVAALCYTSNWVWDREYVGRWASALAGAGVLEMAAGVLWYLNAPPMLAHGAWTSTSLTFAVCLAVGILAYLAMERVYRDRRAGALVLPIFAAVAVVQSCLSEPVGTTNIPAGMADTYWHYGCVGVSVLGYCLLGWGAALSALRLMRERLSFLTPRMPRARALERLLLRVNIAGFVLLLCTAVLWEMHFRGSSGREGFLNPIEPWVLIVVFVYGGHLLLHFALRAGGSRTAFWAVVNFLGTFVGLSAFSLP
jgi:ABC-type uncharacterized transport system permease subunit